MTEAASYGGCSKVSLVHPYLGGGRLGDGGANEGLGDGLSGHCNTQGATQARLW
jgi:hypothetical protein